jgi:predicted Fe-Mo cluster-binding NifX family protein
MKIAVSSQGQDLNSPIDPRFGRARWFIIVETDSGSFEAIDNSDVANATHGAGPLAAQKIASLGVKTVITGHCGPNAFRALQAGGIEIITGISGTIQEAIDKFKKGEVQTTDKPDVTGHWQGMK